MWIEDIVMNKYPASALAEARTEDQPALCRGQLPFAISITFHDSSKKFCALVTLDSPSVLDYKDPVFTL